MEEKKKSDSEFLSYSLMLDCGKATKKNILTLVLSEKKLLNVTKNHNPPFKLNGRSLNNLKMNCIHSKKSYSACRFLVYLAASQFSHISMPFSVSPVSVGSDICFISKEELKC
jgi:hypothetical protein